VAESRRDPGRRAVAAVAGRGGNDVIRGLAAGAAAVVATGAGTWRRAGVVEECRPIRRSAMASVAGRGGDNMARGFGGCLVSVVARCTGSGLDTDVGEARARKRCRGVAGPARQGYRYVIIGHHDGSNAAPHRVASRALCRRALEDTPLVTGIATRCPMRSGQREPRAQMIE